MITQKSALFSRKPVCLTILILFSMSIVTKLSDAQTTAVYVYPSATTVPVGQTITIDIKISAVSDLYGWEFKLGLNPSLLEVLDVTEGPFLKQGGSTFFTRKINNTMGYILVDCTLLGNVPGVSNDGTLASVQLYAEKQGSTALNLYDTMLINSLEQTIPHTANDGSVTVYNPSSSVGGIQIPVNKLELVAPWIGLTSTILVAVAALLAAFKRWKREK